MLPRFSGGHFSGDRPTDRPRRPTYYPDTRERDVREPTFRFWSPQRMNVASSRTPTVGRLREELVFQYTAPDGGTVAVARIVKPYQVLQVNQNASRAEIKAAFCRVANHSRRQERVMASLSYSILMSKVQRYRKISDGSYEITGKTDVIVLAAVGDTNALLAQISENAFLASATDEHNHSLLYLTARAGFYDTTEALLKFGVSVNEKQVDGSTALHVASFFGQRPVVELLLQYGADPTHKNRWNSTAVDEAASPAIRQIILVYKEDRFSQIASSLIKKGLAWKVRFIKSEGVIIGKEILRHSNAFDQRTRSSLNSIESTWITVWHGTQARNLESIFTLGLRPSGSALPDGTIIKPPSGHIALGSRVFQYENWAAAVFVSPSIAYAAHPIYSERIFSACGEGWCVVVKGYVKPDNYTDHHFTATGYKPAAGEPDATEFRIDVTPDDKIFRVEAARNVVVASLVFISLKVLERDLTYTELKSLFEASHPQ